MFDNPDNENIVDINPTKNQPDRLDSKSLDVYCNEIIQQTDIDKGKLEKIKKGIDDACSKINNYMQKTDLGDHMDDYIKEIASKMEFLLMQYKENMDETQFLSDLDDIIGGYNNPNIAIM